MTWGKKRRRSTQQLLRKTAFESTKADYNLDLLRKNSLVNAPPEQNGDKK